MVPPFPAAAEVRAVKTGLRLRPLLPVLPVLAGALLLPGCSWFDEERELAQVFVVVLTVNAALNLILIALLLFYFLPFTRPLRRKKRRR